MNKTEPRLAVRRKPPVAVRKAKSKGRAKVAPHSKTRSGPAGSFPIVGIGASAGGLEALEQFFRNVPPGSGLGFVVVQHLYPTHKGILVELLQRTTPMSVVQVTDRMRVERDHVYVIPPNKDLAIFGGVLHLLEPTAKRGLRLPIDFFLNSLADDGRERSIGVVLSGMGSDGARGLRAIKEKAGACFVQMPTTAKFDSMPRAAIDAGQADVIASAEDLPGRIIAYLRHLPTLNSGASGVAERDQSGREKVLMVLRTQTGHDFSLYKKSTIHRRIERRMGLHQLSNVADYVRYLRENPGESELLFKELLIGVTSFFRDPSLWDELRNKTIPQILAAHPHGGVLRAWCVGCSTGEEAFSLAIVFKEALSQIKSQHAFSLQIFATDLDKDAIDKARAALYPATISEAVSEERLARFFVKQESGDYCVKKEIRETVIFASQNLVMHPPFTKIDLLTCRNLLIYLDAELQKNLMPLFHFSLNSGGVLVLGSSETVGTASDLFAPLPGNVRVYQRLNNARPADLSAFPFALTRSGVDSPSATQTRSTLAAPNMQSLADQLLLQRYSPAAVLVTSEGDILYISGRTGKYLEPAAGKVNWNLFAMCREGLGDALGEGFRRALRRKATVVLKQVAVAGNGGTQIAEVTILPITDPEALRGMVMIVFKDVAKPSDPKPSRPERAGAPNGRLAEMAKELKQAKGELQANRDEMQTSQEELRSTNEEMQSMNEELQSTNEELTTSKEEMQSMNEEMQTVNQEMQSVNLGMQSKVDELSRSSNDMKNLLDSTDIAILFLDNALLVRRFTPQTANIIQLIPTDIGRPITDVVSALDYPALAADAKRVLETQVAIETVISARGERWFRIRIMPYRTQDDKIDGLVITFADTTESKVLEAALRQDKSGLEHRFSVQTGKLRAAKTSLLAAVRGRPAANGNGKRARISGRAPHKPP